MASVSVAVARPLVNEGARLAKGFVLLAIGPACVFGILMLIRGAFDPFDDLVDTTDTVATGDLDEDEAIVAPTGSPGVLDLPIVLVAALHAAAVIGAILAGVPPLGDLAVLLWRRCGRRAR